MPDRSSPSPESLIVVGRLGGAFGVNGEVRLKSFCADPAAIADYTPLTTAEGRSFATLILTGRMSGGLSARLDGVATKEQADALKGADLYADRARLPSLPDDEYYHADLIGLTVLDTGGTLLGTVKSVDNHGAGDLLEVVAPSLKDSVLVPFTLAIVPTVDLAARRIIADPPAGLFPE